MTPDEKGQKTNSNECPCSRKRFENSRQIDEAFEAALAKYRNSNGNTSSHDLGPLSNNPRIMSLINAQ